MVRPTKSLTSNGCVAPISSFAAAPITTLQFSSGACLATEDPASPSTSQAVFACPPSTQPAASPQLLRGDSCSPLDVEGFSEGFAADVDSDSDDDTHSTAAPSQATSGFEWYFTAQGFTQGFESGYTSDGDDDVSILPRRDGSYGCPLEAGGFAAGFAAGYTSGDDGVTRGVTSDAAALRQDAGYGNPMEADGFGEGFETGWESGAEGVGEVEEGADASMLQHRDAGYGDPMEEDGFTRGFEDGYESDS